VHRLEARLFLRPLKEREFRNPDKAELVLVEEFQLARKLPGAGSRYVNLGEKLREARNMFKANTGTQNQASDKAKKTDFTEMSVSFQLQNGVARSNDLSLKSPLLPGGGATRVGRGTQARILFEARSLEPTRDGG